LAGVKESPRAGKNWSKNIHSQGKFRCERALLMEVAITGISFDSGRRVAPSCAQDDRGIC